MLISKLAAAALVGCVVCAVPTRSYATDCAPTITGGEALHGIDAETRLRFLGGRLNAASRASKIWTGSWIGVYSALTIGSAALIPLVKHEQRVDYYFSAGTSAVGLISLGLAPLRAIADARWFNKHAPQESVCAAVADAERLLARDAASEAECQKPLIHIGNIALNFGSLLVMGFVFNRWGPAALQGLAGTLIGEIMIVSTPTVATNALAAYRRGDLTGKPPPSVAMSLGVAPLIFVDGGGMAVGAKF